ncbi:MAG: hypothetical protein ACRYFY_19395 [Janthinobacterium lividum]
MNATRSGWAPAEKAGVDYLERQARFVAIQSEHLHEQREIQLSHLKVRRFSDRLRVATQLFVFMVAALIGLGVAVMVYDAFTAHSVIVDIFDAPPDLAARGLSGQTVAGLVLDELTRFDADTHTASVKRDVSSAWSNDIKVELPETGVSIGELDRMLKSRFGHDLHIGGSLLETGTGGMILTVRGPGITARSFTGTAGDLGRLTTEAAEYLYGESQPPLYAVYLSTAGRSNEAIVFIKSKLPGTSGKNRSFLLYIWALALVESNQSSPVLRIELFRQSLKYDPTRWAAYGEIANEQSALGDEEDAWKTMETMRKLAGGRPGKVRETYYGPVDSMTWNLSAERAALVADASDGVGTNFIAAGPQIAGIDISMHDSADARLQLATSKVHTGDSTLDVMVPLIAGLEALEDGNGIRAANEMEAFGKMLSNPINAAEFAGVGCWIAPAEEMAGHQALADAALASGGHFVDCTRFRGDILDGRGDWRGAQKAYAESVAMAPDLPAGDYSWGLALARHGDLEGAIVKLKAAHARGPNWAEPLKAWGDVLARQNKWAAALAKYNQALPDAPAWDALHTARDAAASRI